MHQAGVWAPTQEQGAKRCLLDGAPRGSGWIVCPYLPAIRTVQHPKAANGKRLAHVKQRAERERYLVGLDAHGFANATVSSIGVRWAFPMEPSYQHGSSAGLQQQHRALRRNHAALAIGCLRVRSTRLRLEGWQHLADQQLKRGQIREAPAVDDEIIDAHGNERAHLHHNLLRGAHKVEVVRVVVGAVAVALNSFSFYLGWRADAPATPRPPQGSRVAANLGAGALAQLPDFQKLSSSFCWTFHAFVRDFVAQEDIVGVVPPAGVDQPKRCGRLAHESRHSLP